MSAVISEFPAFELKNIINLDRYPIDQMESAARADVVALARQGLDSVGCSCLPDFIRPEALSLMKQEVEAGLDQVYWSENSHNPYFSKPDEALPTDHPRNFFERRSSGFFNSDLIAPDSPMTVLYDSEVMRRFVADCLRDPDIYCWADPLGRNPYGVMRPGDYFPWHFDGNAYTVSLLVQEADHGGVFEYCPDIRNPEDECFDDVQAALEGDRSQVKELPLKEGDMQIFKGRYSMHRVTQVTGQKNRYIALPTYTRDPQTVNLPERSKQIYGRATQLHYDRANQARIDKLSD